MSISLTIKESRMAFISYKQARTSSISGQEEAGLPRLWADPGGC